VTNVITYFQSLTNVRGRCVWASWSRIFDHFARPAVCARKEDAAGWSPALFEDNSRGEGKRALSLGAVVVEYDHGVTVDDAVSTWADHYGFLYTTFSHREGAPRLRIVLPLTRRVSPEEHGRLWRWAESVGGAIDPKARDAKRFWFLPAISPGGSFETRELCGAFLDPDEVLRDYVEPTPVPVAPRPRQLHRPNTLERASAYLARMPESVSGDGGHLALWRATLALVRGFGLTDAQVMDLLASEFNPRCRPPWSERELRHKVKQAIANGQRPWGYIADRRSA
jgi:hypothetical protein